MYFQIGEHQAETFVIALLSLVIFATSQVMDTSLVAVHTGFQIIVILIFILCYPIDVVRN